MPAPAQIFDDARAVYDLADRELDLLSEKLSGAIDSGQLSDRVVGLSHSVVDGLRNYRDAIYLSGLMGSNLSVGSDVVAAQMGVEGRDIPHGYDIQVQIARRDQARRNMRAILPRLTPKEIADRAHLMP